jgi:HSP20 family molecular chaperone IbpA
MQDRRKMKFFDDTDDPFEGMLREFFGSSSRGRKGNVFIKGEEEDRNIDFVESENKVYLIFELPGFSQNDVFISVKGNVLEIEARKNQTEGVQDYLNEKLRQGISIRKELPKSISSKNFSHTMKNGILEVVFSQAKWKR